jgi:hypothetical protein
MTNFQSKDLTKLGILSGMEFYVEIGGQKLTNVRGRKFKVKYGSNSFLSVEQGRWYAFEHAEGFIMFSANGFAHPHEAMKEAQASVGVAMRVLKPIGVGAALTGIPGGIEMKKFDFENKKKFKYFLCPF